MSSINTRNLKKQIKDAIGILKTGGIVAYPTDTVYGLGASMTSISALERIFAVKDRPKGMALPLLVADQEQIKYISQSIPPAVWLLIYNFFPGALTIVLNKSDAVPDIITGGAKTIAFRIPNHSVPISIIKGLGQPIVGTSANLSGQPSPVAAEQVRMQIGDKVDMIVDGGNCPGGIESTVVDLSNKKPVIRRLGAITLTQLKQNFPDIRLAKEIKNASRNR